MGNAMDKVNPAKDVEINKYHLDDESRRLPSQIQMYHEACYEMQEELDNVKFRLERDEAKAKVDVRQQMLSRGDKPSVDSVAAEVSMLDSIVVLRRERAAIERRITYLRGVLSSLDSKRSALNNLVSLYVKDYYTDRDVENGKYAEADVKKGVTANKQYDNDSAETDKRFAGAMRRHRNG